MKLRDIMTGDVHVVEPSATIEECARKMRDLDVGAIPVCDGEKVVGIVTDRDITVRAIAEGEDPKGCKVADVMSEGVRWCFDDEDVEKAGRLMRDEQIRRLIVVNHHKKLVGVVSLGDLAVKQGDEALSGGVLEGISEPASMSSGEESPAGPAT